MSMLPTQLRPMFEMRQTSLAACLALAMSLVGAAPIASADPSGSTFVVTNCNDSGVGSLRDAAGLAMSGDTVDMSQLSCNSITLDAEIVSGADDLTLKGAPTSNFGTPSITATSSNTDGLLRHTGEGLLTIENLSLAGGRRVGPSSQYGGCVRSAGSVHMLESAAEACIAESTGSGARGGAIYAADDVYLTGSLVEDSVVKTQGTGASSGGGVYAGRNLDSLHSAIRNNTAVSVSGFSRAGGVQADGATIDGSTISGNEAGFGGGLHLGPSSLSVKIENSTISGNISTNIQAQTAGAWISVDNNSVVLENNTITANVSYAEFGAGLTIRQAPSSTVLTSNIISGNRYFLGVVNGEPTYAPSDLSHTIGVTITGSHNLVGHVESGVVLPADTIRQEQAPFGPLEVPDGGFMGTHAIGTGSWALNLGTTVDNGPSDPPETLDQNGNDRSVGTGVDMGAVESDALFIGRFEDPPTF